MNEDFEEYLQSNDVSPDALLEVFRGYVSERAGYLPPEDMQAEMEQKTGDRKQLARLLREIQGDRDSLLAAARMVLGAVWRESSQRALIEERINNANRKLPLIETGILAIVAMYGMYLIATNGIKEKTETITKGDYTKTTHTINEPPTAPLKAVISLFGAFRTDSDRTERDS